MIPLKALLRTHARALPRVANFCPRQSTSILRPPSSLEQSWKLASRQSKSAFSTARIAWEKQGQVDQELSAKVEGELQIEKEVKDGKQIPPNLQEYLDSTSFKLHDSAGHEEVSLTRKFGDENIKVTFTIADLSNPPTDESDEFNEDRALYDEEPSEMPTDTQSGGASTKGAINQGKTQDGNFKVAPEDHVAPADREELADDETPADDSSQEPSFPARVNVTIDKPGNGCLHFETLAQDGMIMIENVFFYKNTKLADAGTAELDWTRRNVYAGPPFANLDEELQVLLERYLEERGIDTAMALWVPEYVDFKEQKEYIGWLSNVKKFVDA